MAASKKKLAARRESAHPRHGPWIVGLAALPLALFADVLFSAGPDILGNRYTDLYLQFVSWREFGFGELRKGNLALWNPHIFSGAPYFGGFQAALLYPPNWLFLFLPLAQAINWTIALDTILLGLFMYLWAAQRGLRPPACFLAGALMMFCGAHFLHIYAGHLANISAMAWAPLVFLAIDGFFAGRSLRWLAIGMVAVAMQIFAGHPQYVFYTAITAGFYSAMRLICAEGRLRIGLGLLSIYAGGAALAAVQLLPGIHASAETIRGEPLPYTFAAMFGFPPENFLTLIAPAFFGTMQSVPYWGRAYLWEMSLFVGITGLLLAIIGAIYARNFTRWPLIAMIALTLLLALGDYTPLFAALYNWVPGFDKFRSISKFIFQSSLFIVMLSAAGLNHLLGEQVRWKKIVIAVACGALLTAAAAIWIQNSPRESWQNLIAHLQTQRDSYLPAEAEDRSFVRKAHQLSASSLFIAAATMAVACALFAAASRTRAAVYGLLALNVVEILFFVWIFRDKFDSRLARSPQVRNFLAERPGDYRILNLLNPNSAMSIGAQDLWGFDPGVVRRYAEFVAFSQSDDPDQATQYVSFRQLDPLYTMLRLRYVFAPEGNGFRVFQTDAMPRLKLIRRYRVLTERDEIFAAMRDPFFDPQHEVILEMAPAFEPTGDEGTLHILNSSTDHLVIEAQIDAPTVLLLTDVFSDGWRATPLPGSVQQKYNLQPANYFLRAIPLKAGLHRLRVEYRPRMWEIGALISAVAWVLLLAFLLYPLKKRLPRRA